jgi:hypothetical protein
MFQPELVCRLYGSIGELLASSRVVLKLFAYVTSAVAMIWE